MNTCLEPGLILRYDLSNEKGDIRIGMWKVRSLCRAGSLTTAAREIARYILDLFVIHLVQRGRGKSRGLYFFFVKEKIFICGQDFLYRIVSAVKKVEFLSDRVSYIVLRGRWCNIIILNVCAPSEEKSDD